MEETLEDKIKRLEKALELISHIHKKDTHLGRPRMSDLNCILCVAQLSLSYGAFGDYLTTETIEEKLKTMHVGESV